jgi:hypothetical protein
MSSYDVKKEPYKNGFDPDEFTSRVNAGLAGTGGTRLDSSNVPYYSDEQISDLLSPRLTEEEISSIFPSDGKRILPQKELEFQRHLKGHNNQLYLEHTGQSGKLNQEPYEIYNADKEYYEQFLERSDISDEFKASLQTPWKIFVNNELPLFAKNAWKRLKRGYESTGKALWTPTRMLSSEWDEIYRKSSEYNKTALKHDKAEMSGNPLANIFLDVVEMTPALAAGTVAGIAGGPAASSAFFSLTGSGEVYNELVDSGVAPKIAAGMALPAGIVYGTLDRLPLGRSALAKSLARPLKRAALRTALKYGGRGFTKLGGKGLKFGARVVSESLGESGQEAVFVAADVLSRLLNDSFLGTNLTSDINVNDYRRRITEAFTSSLGPMAVISGLGTGSAHMVRKLKLDGASRNRARAQAQFDRVAEAGKNYEEVYGQGSFDEVFEAYNAGNISLNKLKRFKPDQVKAYLDNKKAIAGGASVNMFDGKAILNDSGDTAQSAAGLKEITKLIESGVDDGVWNSAPMQDLAGKLTKEQEGLPVDVPAEPDMAVPVKGEEMPGLEAQEGVMQALPREPSEGVMQDKFQAEETKSNRGAADADVSAAADAATEQKALATGSQEAVADKSGNAKSGNYSSFEQWEAGIFPWLAGLEKKYPGVKPAAKHGNSPDAAGSHLNWKDGTETRPASKAGNDAGLYRADKSVGFHEIKVGNKVKALALVEKMTGTRNVAFAEKLFNRKGIEVFGRYKNAFIDISENKGNVEDTARHEALHYAYDLLLTESEAKSFDRAAQAKGLNHEQAIEKVNDFARAHKGISGKLKLISNRLLHRIQMLFGKERLIDKLNDIYDRALSGKLAKRGATGRSNYGPESVKYMSATDRKSLSDLIKRFISDLDGVEFNESQRGIYDVVTGKNTHYDVRKSDLDALDHYVRFGHGNDRRGMVHIMKEHYSGKKSPVTANDIINIGEIVRSTEPEIKPGKRKKNDEIHVYDQNGLLLVVLKKGKNEKVITLYQTKKAGPAGDFHPRSTKTHTDPAANIHGVPGEVKSNKNQGVD